jgi:hypothetical protein
MNSEGTEVFTIELADFRYGDDVDKFCKKLEKALNDLMIGRGNRK